MKSWILAARLKTLPLAVSGIVMGSALAWLAGTFQVDVCILGIATAVALQILSNFANDYGDYLKGTDSHRSDRMLSAGKISAGKMRAALVGMVLVCLALGIALISTSNTLNLHIFIFFLSAGIIAIAAAIMYTVGKYAYAYYGLGDVFVFVFFGIISVMGIFFLHTGTLNASVTIASVAVGLLSVAVLNINNIRDITSDAENQKRTIPVMIGPHKALLYHKGLLVGGFGGILYSFIHHIRAGENAISMLEIGLIFISFSPVFIIGAGHYSAMRTAIQSEAGSDENVDEQLRNSYHKELKRLSLLVLFTSLFYSILVWLYKA